MEKEKKEKKEKNKKNKKEEQEEVEKQKKEEQEEVEKQRKKKQKKGEGRGRGGLTNDKLEDLARSRPGSDAEMFLDEAGRDIVGLYVKREGKEVQACDRPHAERVVES